MSGLLDQRCEVFSHASSGGMFQESGYTRVRNPGAPDGAWPTRMTAATTREREVAAQSQSEVDVQFTFLDEILSTGGLEADGAIRIPVGVGNPVYKISGEPRQSRLTRRVIVLASRAGDDVISQLVEA